MNNQFECKIPVLTDNKVRVFYCNRYIGEATADEFNHLRLELVKYKLAHPDSNAIENFYIIGHKDGHVKGEELKITINEDGNLLHIPWEFQHNRRTMLELIGLSMKKPV